MKHLVLALLASAGFTSAVHAQSTTVYPSPYIGLGILAADHRFDMFGSSNVIGDGYKASAKLFAGVDFNRNWGLELGYAQFGRADATYTAYGIQSAKMSVKNNAWYLAGKGTLPINDQLSVYAKLGAARMTMDIDSDPDVYVRRERSTDPYGALGIQYQLNDKVALTAEYERYGRNHLFGLKPGVLSVAAKYSFK